jgi:predicted RNA binding protein YcfA (HicA-like mRNA interferase family)
VPQRVKDMIRLVQQDGWIHVRTTGSHRQFQHPVKPGTVTIAGKESAELPPKTERSIRRQAGLSKE